VAHYSSDSQLWYDEHFLHLVDLERQLVLYFMHGPGRSNVPGITEDTAVVIADRLRRSVDDIKAALTRMCEDPEVLQMDEARRIMRCPLAARMDPHRGSKSIRGWHKNWCHLPEAKLKYTHIESLVSKVDAANADQVAVWNETFGAEDGGKHAVGALTPAQLRIPGAELAPTKPKRGKGKHQPRNQEVVKPVQELPGRSGIVHMDSPEYVDEYSADLLRCGVVHAMEADADIFARAMHALKTRAPGRKRVADWDATAANYIQSELFILGLRAKESGDSDGNGNGNGKKNTRGTHESNRGGGSATRRTSRTRERGAAQDDQQGQWSEVLRQKASEPSIFTDT